MDLTKLTYLLLTTFLLVTTAEDSPTCGSEDEEVSVIPIYGRCSPFNPPKAESWVNTILGMASKDLARVNYLTSLVATTSAPIASGQHVLDIGSYVVRAKLGTPGQLMFMVLDTSSDHAWVPCTGCSGCTTTTLFSPNASSTHASVDCSTPQCAQVHGLSCPSTGAAPCHFNQSYGGDSSFSANLVRDSLSLAADVIPDYAFGCLASVSGRSVPPQGLLGLGRGPMSLLSQSGPLYSGVFSYCLPSFKSYYFSGSLKLGPAGQPRTIKTTPLLRSPHRPSLYYVNLTGISVGRVRVPIEPELLRFDPMTGAGTIVDSGTVITRLVPGAYNAVREEMRRQVGGPFSSLGAFDTCFAVTHEAVAPAVTLRFEGMNLVLPMENSLIHSSAGTLACLAMAAGPDSGMNIIANLQQQNLRMLFDLTNSKLGITRELCN